jgi:hypothetical protein
MKLMVEGYFDMSMATLLGFWAFSEVKSLAEFAEFFDTFDNCLCSILTILGMICCIYIPIWSYKEVKKISTLGGGAYQIENKYYELFMTGLSEHCKASMFYGFYFLIRRAVIVLVLTIFDK